MKTKRERPIDVLAKDSYKWHKKAWVFISKMDLLRWQVAVIVTFFIGVFVAIIFLIKFRIETNSAASGTQAVFSISPSTLSYITGETFTANVMLNANGSAVVAQTAIIKYDPSFLQLVNTDTSSSVFTKANNSTTGKVCLYTGAPCQLIENDVTSGRISITSSTPSPGIMTSSTALGNVASLQFKALKAGSSTLDVDFSAVGSYNDSNVIADDGKGTDLLASVVKSSVIIKDPVVTCTSFTYSDWSTCLNGSQSRTVTASLPVGCSGGNPTLTQSCTSTCTSFTYSDWSACLNGSQSRTITSSLPAGCSGGNPTLTQSCSSEICTSFTYSRWGVCKAGKQSRTVLSAMPTGCTGGTPVLSQSCTSNSKRK